jgi:hypothetical protein
MVLPSIRKDPNSNERIIALLQGVGELLYGVDHLRKLDGAQRSNWIKRSNEFAKAQGDFSSLLALLEQVFEEAREQDRRVVEAELQDLEDRFILEAKIASENQKRKVERESEEREHGRALSEVELEEKKRGIEESSTLHAQTMRERETDRKLRRAQGTLVLCVTGFFALLSGALVLYGVVHEETLFVGGSGVTAAITLGGILGRAIGWEGKPATETGEAQLPGTSG